MTWHYEFTDGNEEMVIYDHEGEQVTTVSNNNAPAVTRDSQNVPVDPDFKEAVVNYLDETDAGVGDSFNSAYAVRAVAEAVTAAKVAEGNPDDS